MLGAQPNRDFRQHATGAQCWSPDALLDRAYTERLRATLTEELVVQGSYRVWYLAPLMKPDGYPIRFAADGTIESDVLCIATGWKVEGNGLLLVDQEGRQWYSFRYSEGCNTLVHEYEYGGTAQVLEIGPAIEGPNPVADGRQASQCRNRGRE